jgi:branched-chain amino acid transport system substrate-binding protein
MDYLNEKKVPQLFVSSGDAKWGADPVKYPWTTGGGMPNYADEAVVYAKYLLKNRPEARMGILYQNDDMGITFLKGIEKGLGEKASLILARQSFEITAADVSSQIANLKASGANTLFIAAMHKPVVQTLKTAAQMGWKPFLIIASTGSSMFAMSQVSPEIAEGSITTIFYKDTSDPKWDSDAGMILHKEVMAKYYPEGKVVDAQNMFGMSMAWMVEQILRTTGKTLTREGLQNSWRNMNYDRNAFLMPGIVNKTTPTDPRPLRSLYMAKFEVKEGKGRWAPFGEVLDARGQ